MRRREGGDAGVRGVAVRTPNSGAQRGPAPHIQSPKGANALDRRIRTERKTVQQISALFFSTIFSPQNLQHRAGAGSHARLRETAINGFDADVGAPKMGPPQVKSRPKLVFESDAPLGKVWTPNSLRNSVWRSRQKWVRRNERKCVLIWTQKWVRHFEQISVRAKPLRAPIVKLH